MIQPIDDPVLCIDSPADAAACLETLEKNLDALSPFQRRPMTTFREQDLSNGPTMAQALGRHLPQAMTDLIEIMNKVDWLNSCLRSSLAVARCYQKAFVSVAEDMEELKVQMSALERANNIQGMEEDRVRKRRKTSAWPKNREVEDWVHANVRRIIGMPPSGDKGLYSKDKWPSYDPEEAPNGYVEDPESRKVVWRPNWENLRNAFFGNLVDAAVKACDDDRKNLKLECPSTEETRDRVVAYLENIAKHKCSKQSKKEMDEKRILGRTRTFRQWIKKNWESLPLSKCREASYLRNALFAGDGILRAVHFIDRSEEQNFLRYTENVAADGDGIDDLEDDDLEYDEFLLLCDLYNGTKVDNPGWMVYEPWWWSEEVRLAVWTAYECWQSSLRKTSHTTTPVFHLPFNFHRIGSSGFRLADSYIDTDDSTDLFQPKLKCTKSMVNWNVIAKIHSLSVPDYTDVPSDPFSSTSRLPALLDLLQTQHPGLVERVKKHLALPPCLSEDKLKILWKSRRGYDCSPYRLRLNKAISLTRFRNMTEYIDDVTASEGNTGPHPQLTMDEAGEMDSFGDYSMIFGGDRADTDSADSDAHDRYLDF
ncbi:hypothetical protein LQV05_000565 [Cryptococcus neoformans]|nr:hypothetical protein LQV05_000565 [Cryptococcus neoformans]